MTGRLDVLNVGKGDITVTFNDHDDAEVEKAIKMLEDMQRRGYAILVQQEDGTYQRAESIDREHRAYVVMVPEELPADAPKSKGKKKTTAKKQPIAKSRAVGVARSAGG